MEKQVAVALNIRVSNTKINRNTADKLRVLMYARTLICAVLEGGICRNRRLARGGERYTESPPGAASRTAFRCPTDQ
eukprot:7254532-Pyramimonas_sp.AAC.1